MNNRGSLTIEFAMMMPIVIFMLGLIIQVVFLYNAKIVTKYAAYCAARAGIVEYNAEEQKMAAAIALSSISDTVEEELNAITGILNRNGIDYNMSELNFLYNQTPSALNDRLPSALYRTTIIEQEKNSASNTLRVKILYYYHFRFPLWKFLNYLNMGNENVTSNESLNIFSDLSIAESSIDPELISQFSELFVPITGEVTIPYYE